MPYVQTFPRLLLALCILVAACQSTPGTPNPAVPAPKMVTKTSLPASPFTDNPQATASATLPPPMATTTPRPPQPAPTNRLVPSPSLPIATPNTVYPTPTPAETLELPTDVETVLLLGTDSDAPYAGRTDAILLVFLKTDGSSASLVSIPRDLYVLLPGQKMDRINTAYATGRIPLLLDTIEYNLGVRPDHWGLAHLDDFSHFIDDLGGLPVYVDDPVIEPWCEIPAGDVVLYGYATLCYVRSRNGTTDFERNRRQQQVLYAMFKRFMSLEALQQLPEWFERYRNSVHTDLTLADLLNYIPTALQLEQANVYHYQIDWDEVDSWTVPDSKAQVLIPQSEKIHQILQEAVQNLQTQEK